MARPQSDIKAGYYPLDTAHLPLIASLFQAGEGKILDPCAGEGAALDYLATAWGLTPYANELNHERAAACRQRFGALHAVQGDLRELRASRGAFGVLYCNPPYSHDTTAERAERRTEVGLMKASWRWLSAGGWLIWVVYDYHLYRNRHALTFLAQHSTRTDVYRLPGLHMGTYRQIVVVAQKRFKGQDRPADLETTIEALQAMAHDPPELTAQPTPVYTLPKSTTASRFVFAPARLTPDFALGAVEQEGVQHSARFQACLTPPPPDTLERPITLPKAAQVLMLIVSGFTDGIVLNLSDGRRAMVRGTIQRTTSLTNTEEIVDGDQVVGRKQTFITRPKSVVALLDTEGRIETLDEEGDIVDFIEAYRDALFAYVKTQHPPLYNFDYAGVKEAIDAVRLPLTDSTSGLTELKPLFTTQKHMVAATYLALTKRRRVLIAGEPGLGKTAIGATVAGLVGRERRAGQVVLVVCPPQLTGKWEREIGRMHGLPKRYTAILKRVDDVRDFMERAAADEETLQVGIISREMAKLSSGWRHALHWRARHYALWPMGEAPPDELAEAARVTTVYRPSCPTCGATVTKPNGEPYSPAHFGYDPTTRTYLSGKGTRTQHHCAACGEALYQVKRLKGSLPKPGHKFPARNPRMALAEYIARRFSDRVALLLLDEIHEMKSISSDQGKAMTHLVNIADKSVGLSGTLFGGVASSLYLLLFMFSHHIRRHYPFGAGGQSAFIDDMGVLEQVIEDRPQYENGVYSGTKRYETPAKESPGCSPRLVVETLPATVFAGLQDIGMDMPELIETPVEVEMEAPLAAAYEAGERELKNYLIDLRYEGQLWTFMGAYLHALMNYPDAAAQPYRVVHKERDKLVWTYPGLGDDHITNKEEALLDIVRDELAEGRKVAVFVRQSGKRDIQRRLACLIRDGVAGAKPYILYGGSRGGGVPDDGIPSAAVPTHRREAALKKVLADGHNVLLCNPLLIQTGLDLLSFKSLIFYEILFSLYPVDQASRRHWRIIQTSECRTFYLYYKGTMEERALELVAKKREAAQLLYGDMSADGLAALTGEGGIANDLVKALEHALRQEENTTADDMPDADVDLRELFAKTSLTNYESPWTLAVAAEGVQAAGEVLEMEPTPQPVTTQPVPSADVLPKRSSSRPRQPLPLAPLPPAEPGVQLSLF